MFCNFVLQFKHLKLFVTLHNPSKQSMDVLRFSIEKMLIILSMVLHFLKESPGGASG